MVVREFAYRGMPVIARVSGKSTDYSFNVTRSGEILFSLISQ